MVCRFSISSHFKLVSDNLRHCYCGRKQSSEQNCLLTPLSFLNLLFYSFDDRTCMHNGQAITLFALFYFQQFIMLLYE